jgi:hypothetical protein
LQRAACRRCSERPIQRGWERGWDDGSRRPQTKRRSPQAAPRWCGQVGNCRGRAPVAVKCGEAITRSGSPSITGNPTRRSRAPNPAKLPGRSLDGPLWRLSSEAERALVERFHRVRMCCLSRSLGREAVGNCRRPVLRVPRFLSCVMRSVLSTTARTTATPSRRTRCHRREPRGRVWGRFGWARFPLAYCGAPLGGSRCEGVGRGRKNARAGRGSIQGQGTRRLTGWMSGCQLRASPSGPGCRIRTFRRSAVNDPVRRSSHINQLRASCWSSSLIDLPHSPAHPSYRFAPPAPASPAAGADLILVNSQARCPAEWLLTTTAAMLPIPRRPSPSAPTWFVTAARLHLRFAHDPPIDLRLRRVWWHSVWFRLRVHRQCARHDLLQGALRSRRAD